MFPFNFTTGFPLKCFKTSKGTKNSDFSLLILNYINKRFFPTLWYPPFSFQHIVPKEVEVGMDLHSPQQVNPPPTPLLSLTRRPPKLFSLRNRKRTYTISRSLYLLSREGPGRSYVGLRRVSSENLRTTQRGVRSTDVTPDSRVPT